MRSELHKWNFKLPSGFLVHRDSFQYIAPITEEHESPLPDSILLIVFGILALLSLAFGAMSLYFAVKNAKKPDGELKMAFWSFGALAGLVFAGMASAYFLLPILFRHLFPG